MGSSTTQASNMDKTMETQSKTRKHAAQGLRLGLKNHMNDKTLQWHSRNNDAQTNTEQMNKIRQQTNGRTGAEVGIESKQGHMAKQTKAHGGQNINSTDTYDTLIGRIHNTTSLIRFLFILNFG